MRHGKMYERKYGDRAAAGYSEEERMRMKIWLDNRARIETHNKHFNTAGRGEYISAKYGLKNRHFTRNLENFIKGSLMESELSIFRFFAIFFPKFLKNIHIHP